VTSQASFGDFLQAARWQLDPAAGACGTVSEPADVREVTQSLLRIVTVIARYAGEITFPFQRVRPADTPLLNAWARASIEARQALANAAVILQPYGASRRQHATPADGTFAERLDTAAVSLATGRDLLQTHFAPGPHSGRQPRTDWALAISSPPVTRTLLTELGSLARQIAPQGTVLALSRPRTRTGLPRSGAR